MVKMYVASIKMRLILTLALILCIAFIATSMINYHVSREAIRNEIVSSSLPLTRDNIYFEIQADLMRPIFISSLMANNFFLKEWAITGENDPARVVKYLKDIRDKYNFISTFFISAKTNKYYHFKGIHKVISPQSAHDVWYYKFIAMKTEYDLDVDTDEAAEKQLTLFVNFRVETDDGKLLGVTGVGVKLANVAALFRSYQKKFRRSVYMTDLEGNVQLHSNPGLVENLSIREMEGVGSLADKILVPQIPHQDFSFFRSNERVLLTVRYMPVIGWYLFVEQEEGKAFAALRTNLIQNLSIGTIAIFVVLIAVTFTVNLFQNKLERMAVTDELTSIANRRAFEDQFNKAVYRYERSEEPFSIILFDLDSFKAVNDQCGHIEGDRLLKELAELTQLQIRKLDLLARWGGDEFIVLVVSDQQEAQIVAERIRKSIDNNLFTNGMADENDPRQAVTASIGVTEYCKADTLDLITHRADKALYTVKAKGGNGVCVADKIPT